MAGFLSGLEFPLLDQGKREGLIAFLVRGEIDRLGIRIELGLHGLFQDNGSKEGRTALLITQSLEASGSLMRCLGLSFRCGRWCCLRPEWTRSNLKMRSDVGAKRVWVFPPSKGRTTTKFISGIQCIIHFFSRASTACSDHRRSCRRRRFSRP